MPFSPFTLLHRFLYSPWGVTVVALALMATFFLFRFDRSWATGLLLVGTLALFVLSAEELAFAFAFDRGWVQRTFLMQGCVVSPVLDIPLRLIELISWSLPIGVVWYCVRLLKGLTTRWS